MRFYAVIKYKYKKKRIISLNQSQTSVPIQLLQSKIRVLNPTERTL
ncbi:hypothetical protein FHS10_000289 [Mucilaginibacter dorajii]|nr:hypothetical protein [Mucilaginibacter dorajii]